MARDMSTTVIHGQHVKSWLIFPQEMVHLCQFPVHTVDGPAKSCEILHQLKTVVR